MKEGLGPPMSQLLNCSFAETNELCLLRDGGADALIELDASLVEARDMPVYAAAAAVMSDLAEPLHEFSPNVPASILFIDVQVIEPQPGFGDEA